LKENTLIC